MSGFYLIGVVGLWLWLTWRLLRFGKRMLSQETKTDRSRRVLMVVIIIAWFGASFWYGGGRKLVYDAVVLSLCTKDGGVKVYERVELPAERFDKWGMVNFYKPNQGENALGAEYVFKGNTMYYRQSNPEMWKAKYQVIRSLDGKLLGETILYGRAGGDLPGPWHPSGYRCPTVAIAGPNAMLKAVFILKEK